MLGRSRPILSVSGEAKRHPETTGAKSGHKLHLRCVGTASPGSPTIVYLHGLGGDGSDVESINTQLASQARVCTYDRLNVGRSDSDPGRHTGADSVRDLHALLEAAGVPGPYLLVGFSFPPTTRSTS
jgi:pimeloyl-ACP methyl ester carboxylesterase